MRVVLNRIFLVVTLLVTLAAHYGFDLAWKEAVVVGAAVALVYYIAWELRTNRIGYGGNAEDN
jgi:inner membrane protein involved in colicin E2 resistance